MEDESLAPGFFIVGPTATGKSEIAAEVAHSCGGEIVSADAFQIYRGLDILTAKPEPEILSRVPHHLIGAVPLTEEMNAERFRQLALKVLKKIPNAVIVGGSGMYVKALTDGLSPLPKADPKLRERLEHLSEGELLVRLALRDPATAKTIDARNKRRLIRALEICLLTGRPVSQQRQRSGSTKTNGVFVFRDREDLHARINARVRKMFDDGVVAEVRATEKIGPTSAQTLGLQQIHEFIAGRISKEECIAAIQQATRRYAKRQLTWFRHQTKFEPLNLTRLGPAEAIEWITRKARLSLRRSS